MKHLGEIQGAFFMPLSKNEFGPNNEIFEPVHLSVKMRSLNIRTLVQPDIDVAVDIRLLQ